MNHPRVRAKTVSWVGSALAVLLLAAACGSADPTTTTDPGSTTSTAAGGQTATTGEQETSTTDAGETSTTQAGDTDTEQGSETTTTTGGSETTTTTGGSETTTTIEGAQNQSIQNFNPPAKVTFGDLLYALVATASSGLDVEYEWLSGPCVVNSTEIKDTGAGTCRVRAFQDGNDQWNAVSSTRDIEIAKAPHVFTFADRTIPWRPTDRPVQLWATLPSGAPINYNVIDKGEEFPPCRLSGTSLIVDTRTVVAECTLVATQRSTHPDYVDATPKQAKVTIVNPQWVWSFDSTKHSWANDGPNLNVTVSEKAGTTTGLDLFNFSGPCSHLETRANAARTVYTIALNFTGPGTCQFTVMGDPPDFALDPPLGGLTLRATVDQ